MTYLLDTQLVWDKTKKLNSLKPFLMGQFLTESVVIDYGFNSPCLHSEKRNLNTKSDKIISHSQIFLMYCLAQKRIFVSIWFETRRDDTNEETKAKHTSLQMEYANYDFVSMLIVGGLISTAIDIPPQKIPYSIFDLAVRE
ncbi:hypothetical protein CEXT_544611 [Caerostris extrusa]|uniref:Uncharacterized protein n=1 Tax=Caerostris extrusa TaxID=172846 RepID=A0AAV4P1A3_CAEEX|nr:hypothetical protein CEXT_544611 [Caerostris extrusa]